MVVCRMTLMVCKTKRSKIEIEKKTKCYTGAMTRMGVRFMGVSVTEASARCCAVCDCMKKCLRVVQERKESSLLLQHRQVWTSENHNLSRARHFLQLFWRDPEAFPGQPRDIVSPACPGSSPGPLPGGACPEHISRETSRTHPKQMPEPPQLSPFDVEEQRLCSELLPGDRAPYPISKRAPRHPTKEAHFGRLCPGSYPFGHDPELMTIGESRNID
ncbi:hypothetical protein QTP86_003146 [Hemibagrus guttatus]|nr:hypothetical protein QTP86_003146 [Hemibagrus guttatus]